jgi:tripartite-type tricarboxylate transporter receptor subunit TctC
MYRRTLTLLFSTLVLATALPASVLAQSYPSKPIKFIVPVGSMLSITLLLSKKPHL